MDRSVGQISEFSSSGGAPAVDEDANDGVSFDNLLEIQRDLAVGLFSCQTLGGCLELLLDSAMRLPGFDCGGIYLRDGESGALRLVAHHGLSDGFVSRVESYGPDTPQARMVADGELVYALVSELPPDVASVVQAEGLQALAVLPIRYHNDAVASLNVSSHCRPWIGPSSLVALEGLVAQAESAVELIRTREDLETRVAERTAELETLNAELREKTSSLELALEASQAGVSTWEYGSEAINWNQRMRTLFGFEENELISLEKMIERIHPDDRKILLDDIAAIDSPAAGVVWNHEFRIIHPSLGERWISRLGRVERDAEGRALRTRGISFDITGPKLQQEALRESEEKYRRLHDSMTEAVASVSLNGRIIESNKAFQTMLGYTHDELCQLTYLDITPEKWHQMEQGIAASQKLFGRGYSDLYEKEYRRKDGTVFPVELRVFVVRDSTGEPALIWAIIRDITERKQAEMALLEWNQTLEKRVGDRTARLHESEVRLRQLAEATFEGIAITENGILLDGNTQLARLHGYDIAEMIGRPVIDFVAPESRAFVMERIRDGCETTYEFISLRKDGSTFPMEAHACMRNWQGLQTRVTALRDVTEIKRAHAHLHTMQTELEHAQRLGLVSEVSAGIIHQIGQPLCAMSVNIAAALGRMRACSPLNCTSLSILTDIEADVARLREAVVRLRALANPGQMVRNPGNFNAMVADVVRILSQEAERRSVVVETDFCPNLQPVECDSVQLSQVVLNLMHNAFDACNDRPPDKRSVKVVTRSIGDNEVELIVSDTGSGLVQGGMEHLFAPFFTTKPEGLGMGLRLSQTIVRAHGGNITGNNNPDGPGAVFRVTLPMRSADQMIGDYTKG